VIVKRKNYPLSHTLYVILGLLLTVANIYLALNSYFEIDTKFILLLFSANVWLLIEFPSRKVHSISLDTSLKRITIEYEVMIILKQTVTIQYEDLQFLAYSLQSQLDRINHRDDVAVIRFYDKRKYIAKITQGIDGWTEDDIQSIFQQIVTKGKRLQLSPGLF
jgi:hypothetical protein